MLRQQRRIQDLKGTPEGNSPLSIPRSRWEDNIKVEFQDLRERSGLD
jgi:hypothetical protein